jgi:iron(III) transport system permease protein
MFRWRTLIACVLVVIYLPLAWPLVRLVREPSAWASFADSSRLLALAGNSLALTVGTLLLCVPAGVFLAVLLARTDLPGRRWLGWLLLLTLFIPLPLFTSAWQTILGAEGWWPLPGWSGGSAVVPGQWAPWGQGIGSAVWIHAVAGLPWVVLMVEPGLRWVEREVEESALLEMAPWQVLLRVTLPRAKAAIAMAVLWVAVQTAGEITVTDVMQVRTFAEEIYTQMVLGGTAAEVVTRSLAVAVPGIVLGTGLVLLVVRSWERSLPPAEDVPPPRIYSLGAARWPAALLATVVCVGLLLVPLGGLVWRAGLSGTPARWSAPELIGQVRKTTRAEGRRVEENLVLAVTSGSVAGGLALLLGWVCLEAPRYRVAVFALLALACATPGPVIGLGLKGLIDDLLSWTGSPGLLSRLLWDGPSYLPLFWVHLIRFLPCALALVWPVLRLVPHEWRDLARVDGATPGQELRYLYLPLALPSVGRSALAVAVLALGELSAGKVVSTPQAQGYAELVFAQMHYGITPSLAAQCLLLLGAVLAGGALVAWLRRSG